MVVYYIIGRVEIAVYNLAIQSVKYNVIFTSSTLILLTTSGVVAVVQIYYMFAYTFSGGNDTIYRFVLIKSGAVSGVYTYNVALSTLFTDIHLKPVSSTLLLLYLWNN